MRKAFTLIELLVVIAIIAILAAILFPVFAQAKIAAKSAASISNSKQINLAMIMYGGDYDDVFTIANVWDSPTANLQFSGGVLYNNWVWNVYPYMKNADIMQDPLGPPITTAGFSKITQSTATPTYGYNYTHLSPSFAATPLWNHTALSQSALGKPSETVMLTSRFEQTTESGQPYNVVWWYGARTITTMGMVDPPDCLSATVVQYCFGNWGNGGFWQAQYPLTKESSKWTAGSAIRGAQKIITSMADGSCKKMSPSALAIGTNWRLGTAAAPFVASTLVVNDTTKYLWDEL